MALRHKHRVLMFAPNARVAALRLWIRNNIDPAGSEGWFVPCPAKPGYHWFSASLTDPQLRLLVTQLASLANLAAPQNFDALTRADKKRWFADNRAAVRSAAGCVVFAGDSEGAPADLAAALGEVP